MKTNHRLFEWLAEQVLQTSDRPPSQKKWAEWYKAGAFGIYSELSDSDADSLAGFGIEKIRGFVKLYGHRDVFKQTGRMPEEAIQIFDEHLASRNKKFRIAGL